MLFGDLNHSLESDNVTCSRCGCDYIQKCRFAFEFSPFLFIETDGITTIKFDNLPKSLDILGNTYKLLNSNICLKSYKPFHFVSIFNLNKDKYLVNDFVTGLESKIPRHSIDASFYY